MDSNDNFVKVTIYGQEYTIKAPADASYIKNIAEYVDEKMREVQEELSTPQVPAKVAILAAMNIADDLFAEKRNREKNTNEVERKVSSLIEVVEEAIQQ
tara:strand:- start:177 stop:473 length:297 start_codon:yes stop_codon:yes gene_type:complete